MDSLLGNMSVQDSAEKERTPEWLGMILFIASEALIFANIIAAYLYLEVRNGNWTLPNGQHLEILYPLINTCILVSSSFPVHMAGRAAREGNQTKLKLGLFLTALLGIIFLSGQVYEYTTLTATGFTISSNIFGSAFFTLTGFHGLHVTIGVLFLLICGIRASRGDFTPHKHFAVEAAELYWHFVDIVWIAVFSIVYLFPLLKG